MPATSPRWRQRLPAPLHATCATCVLIWIMGLRFPPVPFLLYVHFVAPQRRNPTRALTAFWVPKVPSLISYPVQTKRELRVDAAHGLCPTSGFMVLHVLLRLQRRINLHSTPQPYGETPIGLVSHHLLLITLGTHNGTGLWGSAFSSFAASRLQPFGAGFRLGASFG